LTGIGNINIRTFNGSFKSDYWSFISIWIGLTQVPEAMVSLPDFLATLFGESAIVIACIVALVLNIIIPAEKKTLEN